VAIIARYEWRRAVAHEGVQLGPILPPDLDDVLEARVGNELYSGALPLEKGVGGDCGAVEEHERNAGFAFVGLTFVWFTIVRLPLDVLQYPAQALQDGIGRIIWRRGKFQ
jgi:hypothetical protein